MEKELSNLINSHISAAAEKVAKAETAYKNHMWNGDFIFSKFQEYLAEQLFYGWLSVSPDIVDDICKHPTSYVCDQINHMIEVRMGGPKNNRADMVLLHEVKVAQIQKKVSFLFEVIRLLEVKLSSEAMIKLQLLRK